MVDFKYSEYCKIPEEQIIFCALTGAHSFGWVTKKSDVDLRVLYLPTKKEIIDPFHSLKIKQYMESPPLDITTIPFGHFCSLLTKGNANYLENLYMPKTNQNEKDVSILKDIVGRNLHKAYLGHYLGYYDSLQKDLHNQTRIERYGYQKLILNAYRVLLSGIVLEKNHRVLFNLYELDMAYPTTHVINVLEDYLAGKEPDYKYLEISDELVVLKEKLYEMYLVSNLPDSSNLASELLDFYSSKVFEIQSA